LRALNPDAVNRHRARTSVSSRRFDASERRCQQHLSPTRRSRRRGRFRLCLRHWKRKKAYRLAALPAR